MLGPANSRRLDELIAIALEDLVLVDHFYRHLDAKLDLSQIVGMTPVAHAALNSAINRGVGGARA